MVLTFLSSFISLFVTAALRECWGHNPKWVTHCSGSKEWQYYSEWQHHSIQAANPRATDPKTSGTNYKMVRPPLLLNLNIGGHVPGIFFNTDGIHWLSFPVPRRLLEIVALRWRRRSWLATVL